MTSVEAGLAGVTAGESAICTVGKGEHGLMYRGYTIEDLCLHASFEEVAYLLIYGQLPTRSELSTYEDKLMRLRSLPPELKKLLQLIPKTAHPMDVLRTACSYVGTIEPENDFSMQTDVADRLLAIFPGVICYWYAYHQSGIELNIDNHAPGIASYFLTLLHGKEPHLLQRQMMNISLILYAEHEFNASTFAARASHEKIV